MKFISGLILASRAVVALGDECPVNAWDTAASAPYRPQPITDADGGFTVIGWLPEYADACESCGYSSGSTGAPGDDSAAWQKTYQYNYAWNVEVAMKSFWEDSSKGWKTKPKWWKSCPAGYERDSWKWWSAKCVIPGSAKFLGETCSDKDQCHNSFVEGYVDTTCAPTNNDVNDPQWKCVLDEESNTMSAYASTCSCIGFLWCESSDCNGNQCVLSTMDMKKHCKYADEGAVWGKSCSNCRKNENACKAYGGADSSKTDSSKIGIAAGVVGMAAVVGVGLTRKLRKKPESGEGGVQMTTATIV